MISISLGIGEKPCERKEEEEDGPWGEFSREKGSGMEVDSRFHQLSNSE